MLCFAATNAWVGCLQRPIIATMACANPFLFDLESNVAIEFGDDGWYNATSLAPDLAEPLQATLEVHSDWEQATFAAVVPEDLSKSFSFGRRAEPTNLASILNRWNVAFKDGISPLAFYIIDATTVLVLNMSEHEVWLYVNGRHRVAVFPAMGSGNVKTEWLAGWVPESDAGGAPIVVLSNTLVLYAEAILHRKNDKGSYRVDEYLFASPGVYETGDELVAHLNARNKMRGERNGTIFHFVWKAGRIQVHATHRQPKPSLLILTPVAGVSLGLSQPKSMILRTKAKIVFDVLRVGVLP